MEIILKKKFTTEDHTFLSSLNYLPKHLHMIKSAIKMSSHKPTSKYFKDINSPFTIHGHHEDVSKSIFIYSYNNYFINYPHYTADKQHIYELDSTGYIFDTIKEGMIFLNNSSWSWQHFIQDTLHYVAFARDFLQKNPDINIVFEKPREDFKCLEFIMKNIFGLSNKIIYLNPNVGKRKIFFNKLYCCEMKPNILYSCPPYLRRLTHNYIMNFSRKYESNEKYLTYLTRRNCSMRKVRNEDQLIICLKKYANIKGLKLNIVDTTQQNFEDIFKIIYNSKIIIAPHGGANFNIYWAQQNTIFIEFGFIKQLETVMNIARSIGLKYYLFPNNQITHGQKEFDVDLLSLNELISSIDC